MNKWLFVDVHGTLLYYPHGVKDRSDTRPIFPELPAFFDQLAQLKEKGFKIIAFTNSKISKEQIRIELSLAGFNPDVFSEIYSCPRPSREGEAKLWRDFFRLSQLSPALFSRHSFVPLQAIAKAVKVLEIAQKEKVPKQNIMIVGDTPSTDLLAARIIGVQHAWANPRKKLKYMRIGYRDHPAFKEPRIKATGRQKRYDWTNQKAIKRFLKG